MPPVRPVASRGDLAATLAKWHTFGFAGHLGMSPVEEQGDEAVAALTIDAHHRNPGGAVHGGVAFALIDTLMGYVVNRATQGEAKVGTVSQSIDFLAVPEGRIVARARVDRLGKTTAFVSGEAHDGEGRLVARSSSVWAVRH